MNSQEINTKKDRTQSLSVFSDISNNKNKSSKKPNLQLNSLDKSLISWFSGHMNKYEKTRENPVYTNLCDLIMESLDKKGCLDDVVRLKIKRIKHIVELGNY